MSAPSPVDDFDIAKIISDKLKDLDRDRQERILRWVAEGIGLSTVTTSRAAASPAPTSFVVPPAVSSTGGSSDIKTFVAAKAPKSDTQFAATVAYYYRFEAAPNQRQEKITGTLLQEAARLAGRKRMTDPRNTLNNAKAAGYLDGLAPGEFAINSVGENLVAMTLPGGGEPVAKKSRKKKTKR